MQKIKNLCILTPTYNEEENIEDLIDAIYQIMRLRNLNYKHVIIDNCSTDATVELVKRKIDNSNYNTKIIINNENYGPIISPVAGVLQCEADAVIIISSDFEDPPHLINNFIEAIESGYDFAAGVIVNSNENFIMKNIRLIYYYLLNILIKNNTIKNFNGYCIINKNIIEKLREKKSLYLFLRSEIVACSSNYKLIEYEKKIRQKGESKNKLKHLFTIAITGFLANKVPITQILLFGYITMSVITFFILYNFIFVTLLIFLIYTTILVYLIIKIASIHKIFIFNFENSLRLYKVKEIYE